MLRRVLTAASAVVVAAVVAPPATGLAAGAATTPPTAAMHCDSGARTIVCGVTYSSSTPVQIRWTLRGSPISGWDNLDRITLGCSQPTQLGVTVANSSGSATTGRLVNCNHGEWP
ncbi:hypothetical protein O7627_16640 [Solwaraspora sp. WMMD1047]|uniref:hypothetical protein n=1 Tax=Solwaraspora sp. WMMD1047 TaxID=3016102 RepID=UPI0024176580|nr:hypothetical protein [Solwaraspora sp. WMMD1047]MDG4830923.1 hypothetical protein [Solwaraspora sp. WMMD1047]